MIGQAVEDEELVLVLAAAEVEELYFLLGERQVARGCVVAIEEDEVAEVGLCVYGFKIVNHDAKRVL